MVHQAAHSPGDQELEQDDPDGLFPAVQFPVMVAMVAVQGMYNRQKTISA